jgi:hypothetical protein
LAARYPASTRSAGARPAPRVRYTVGVPSLLRKKPPKPGTWRSNSAAEGRSGPCEERAVAGTNPASGDVGVEFSWQAEMASAAPAASPGPSKRRRGMRAPPGRNQQVRQEQTNAGGAARPEPAPVFHYRTRRAESSIGRPARGDLRRGRGADQEAENCDTPLNLPPDSPSRSSSGRRPEGGMAMRISRELPHAP